MGLEGVDVVGDEFEQLGWLLQLHTTNFATNFTTNFKTNNNPPHSRSYNNQDQIMWSFYDQYKCKDDGQQTTMATPVADYVKNLYDSMKLENEIKQANGDSDAIDEDDFAAVSNAAVQSV